jgi:hypothetical protein
MTRDVYAWIDPWSALDGPRIVRDLEWSPEDIAAMQRPGVVQFVPNRIEPPEPQPFTADEIASFQAAWNTWANPRILPIRFDAKTQDEPVRYVPTMLTGSVRLGEPTGQWEKRDDGFWYERYTDTVTLDMEGNEVRREPQLSCVGFTEHPDAMWSDPIPDRSVPIWLLAIIMLGIAFGLPMIVGWVW